MKFKLGVRLTLEAKMGVMQFEGGCSFLKQLWASSFSAVLVDHKPDGVLHAGSQRNHGSDGPWTPFHRYTHHHFRIFLVALHIPKL